MKLEARAEAEDTLDVRVLALSVEVVKATDRKEPKMALEKKGGKNVPE